MELGLRDKCAIVTGGSRGLGKQCALSLSAEGAKVVVVARDLESVRAAAHDIATKTNGQVEAIACDTGDDESVREMVKATVDALGGVDILVNCAAPRGPSPRLAEINDENFMVDMNVKVLGYLRCIREVAPVMAARGGGRIINVGGLMARRTGTTIGSVRNIAVASLTKNVADELASSAITAVVVHPGSARTERTVEQLRKEIESGLSEKEAETKLGAGSLLGRLIDSQEIGDIVAFLASPKAVAINGDGVAVGGGVPGVINY